MLQNVAAAATKSSKKSSSKIEWYVLFLQGVILGVGAGMPVGVFLSQEDDVRFCCLGY